MKRILTLTAVCAVLTPGFAAAQACIGVPTMGGQFAVTGQVGFPENARSYSGEFTADVVGPLSLGAHIGVTKIDNVDGDVTTFGGQAAYEVSGTSISACPVVGAEHSSRGEKLLGLTVDTNVLVIPVGLGIGTLLAAGASTDVVLFAVPQFLHIRTTVDGTGQDTVSDNEFGAEAGARFVFGSIFAGAGVFMTSIEDDDPTFNVSLGLTFGGR